MTDERDENIPDGVSDDRPDPRQHFHGLGDVVEDDVLRRFSDPVGEQFSGPDARQAIEGFLRARSGELKSGDLDVREVSADQGVNTLRIRYVQYINGVPLLGRGIHASADVARAAVTNVQNTLDVGVSGAPDPASALPVEAVTATALRPFATGYGTAEVIGSRRAYLRDDSRPPVPEVDYPTATRQLLQTGVAADDAVHLVHEVQVETNQPFERFRVVVDAVSGQLLFIELLGRYVTASGSVFMPDPVSESDNGTLSSASNAATLNALRHSVTFEVAAASGGQFRLEGDWFRAVDWDTPTFAVPSETTANFTYDTHPANRHFLNVNTYYWLDSFARYLRTLGNPTLNANMTRVDVDSQGFNGADNSEWVPGSPNRIRFGEGGVPDAADLGVIIHEYLHGVFQFLGSSHGGSGSYEHSFCDAIAAIYRDQHNPARHRRTETFPFDNNATNRWSSVRTLDRTERFDDPGFAGFGSDLRNSMLGTVIWQMYLRVGGDSTDAGVRQGAADQIIRSFLEALLIVADDSSNAVEHARSLAEGMIQADVTLTGGANGAAFFDAAVAQGLLQALPSGPVATGDDMQPGEVLYPGQSISSANGRYVFVYQGDGNLVLYGPAGALWASNTNGQPVGVTIMQGDGNLVIYGRGGVVPWASGTDGNPGARLVVQDDGNVVIYRTDGSPAWDTGTWLPTGPSATGDDMAPGEVLNPGQSVSSADGRYVFVYQTDGNLVLYGPAGALWASNTNGAPVGVAIMQGDGNLVIYGPGGTVVWASNTDGNPGARLVVQDDGNVVIYRIDGSAAWDTGTWLPTGPSATGDDMAPGEVLNPGQSISSADGRYVFVYQTDGNLVLYGPAGALWASNTNGQPVGVTIMQGDGNLVIYGPGGSVVWASNTDGNPGARLVVQDDGNVVIYRTDGSATWDTGTWVSGGPVATGDDMQPGEVLNPGQSVSSANGRYVFVYQGDGNLVLYGPAGALWASNTNGQPVGVTIMQGDGNLVVYGPGGTVVWASNTDGNPGARLVAQDDGNVVIYRADGSAVWSTNTWVPTGPGASGDDMAPGEVLNPGQSISSADGRYAFTYQTDGNLVLYGPAGALWASNTNGQPVGVTIMQGDGNLVIYGPGGTVVWASNTDGNPGARLVAQNDGNVVIYRTDGSVPWATNTVQP